MTKRFGKVDYVKYAIDVFVGEMGFYDSALEREYISGPADKTLPY